MNTDQSAAGAGGPPPRLKDRYRLVDWLGKGGMGVVYLAHDEFLSRDVAIKFLAPKWISDLEAGDRFLREARAIARLLHPNIMTLYDADREGIWHYLVLEYIQGQDLQTRRVERGGRLPVNEALPIMRSVLEALAHAHTQGVVHRDIKPQNIMITPAGQVKVTDFGLALAQGDIRLTQEGMIIGSPFYLAPEMVSDGLADHRTDLYAVGAVLYELLTGQPPFSGPHPMTILPQILTTPITPPHLIEPDVSAGLEQILLKLLAKKPADRYASAAEALAALNEQSAPIRPPGWAEPGTSDPALLQLFLAARYAEDTVAAVEAERRRLAHLLQSEVIESLTLLLSQANAYEQSLGANPVARMAVSVLNSLARQTLQQVRDLEANLRSTILETLGLEPALEALAAQVRRARGLQINLVVARLPERLPSSLELALFRTSQAALDYVIQHARASEVMIRLERRDEALIFNLADNGLGLVQPAVEDSLRPACQRLEQLGAEVKIGRSPSGGLELRVTFVLARPTQLTSRELEVLQLLAQGLSNKQIARALSVTPRTVNFHLDNIYSKLGVSSRTEAMIAARRQGFLDSKFRLPG